jgi:Ca-activated chloride channel family protein
MPTLVVPEALLLWIVVAVLAWLAVRARRRLHAAANDLGLVGLVSGGSRGWLALVALGITVLALARPLGAPSSRDESIGRDVVFLIDVSRSMGAADAVPDRLGVAVESARLILDAIGRSGGDSRAGVIAFAGEGVVRCPLTSNLGAVSDVLSRLTVGSVRPGGTNLAGAVAAACHMLEAQARILPGTPSLVVLSDGEDLADSLSEAVALLKGRGIVLHAISIGDADSAHPIPWPPSPGSGSRADGQWLEWGGHVVQTRRHDESLRELALSTGGAMLPLGLAAPIGLDRLFAERMAPLAAPMPTEGRAIGLTLGDRRELSPVLAFAALIAVVLATWRGPTWRASAVPGLALMALLTAAQGPPNPDRPRSSSAGAHVAAELGDESAALAAFVDQVRADPRASLPRLNAAAILFRLHRFAEADAMYGEARIWADDRLRPRIDFALGNTKLALGRPAEALVHYDACLASQAPGPDLDAIRQAAAENRAYTEELLRRLQNEEGPDPTDGDSTEGEDESGRDETVMPPDAEAPDDPSDPTTSPSPDSVSIADRKDPRDGSQSPERQLDRAVERIERSLSRRIQSSVLTGGTGGDVERDW